MKTNKTLLWVGIGSALLIGGGLFWWFRKSAKDKEAAKEAAEDKATQEKEKEIVKTEKVEDNTPTLPSTPFKNKTEGDAFRVWMSSAHPEFRYKNDILGKSGEYNNSFMKEAYSKYGAEYQLFLTKKADVKVKDAVKDNSSLTPLQQVEQNLKLDGIPFEVYTDKIIANYTFKSGDKFRATFSIGGVYYLYKDDWKGITDYNVYITQGKWSEGGKKLILKNGRVISNANIYNSIIASTSV